MEKFNDREILAFLRRSGIAEKSAGFFDNPIDYLNVVYNFFYDIKRVNHSEGSIPIRFCPSCIVESIRDQGFGYLKSEWLFKSKCNSHQQTLITLRALGAKKVINALISVLSGKTISEYDIDITENESTNKINDKNKCGFHVMPCLLNDFYRWASMWRDDDYLGFSFYEFYHPDGRRKSISDKRLHSYFSDYAREYPRQFEDFLSCAESKNYLFGLSQVCSLNEMLIKSNKHNCSKCTRWHRENFCPIKPILFVKLEPRNVVNYHHNPCDFYLQYKTHMHN